MIVLKFHRFGTLWSYNGIPVYVGRTCITKSRLVWWWPVNWLAMVAFVPYAAYQAISERFSRSRP